MSLDLTTLHAQLASAEATVRAARVAVERAIAEQIRQQPEPETKKVPPTFGDSESHKPQER